MRIAVIGGGPAGISAAIWAKRLGLSPVLYERDKRIGGQLHQISLPIVDLPGEPGITAQTVVQNLHSHLHQIKIPVELNVRVVGMEDRRMLTADGGFIAADKVIYAPGLKDRVLAVPGSECISHLSTGEILRQRLSPILIVGGGDRALEAACRLAEAKIGVSLVHWRATFSARPEFQDRLKALPVQVMLGAQVVALKAVAEGCQAEIVTDSGQRNSVTANRVMVRIGMEPDLEPGLLVGLHGDIANSQPGEDLMVIGDAVTPAPYRSLVEAYASGMRAAKSLVMNE